MRVKRIIIQWVRLCDVDVLCMNDIDIFKERNFHVFIYFYLFIYWYNGNNKHLHLVLNKKRMTSKRRRKNSSERALHKTQALRWQVGQKLHGGKMFFFNSFYLMSSEKIIQLREIWKNIDLLFSLSAWNIYVFFVGVF